MGFTGVISPLEVELFHPTLEVQPPFFIGWFTNHLSSCKGLSNHPKGSLPFGKNGGNDLQGLLTGDGSEISNNHPGWS